jgi:hypothetical protein
MCDRPFLVDGPITWGFNGRREFAIDNGVTADKCRVLQWTFVNAVVNLKIP